MRLIRTVSLSLALASVGAMLSAADLTVDGVSKPRWRLAIRDGALVIEKQGLSVILK